MSIHSEAIARIRSLTALLLVRVTVTHANDGSGMTVCGTAVPAYGLVYMHERDNSKSNCIACVALIALESDA